MEGKGFVDTHVHIIPGVDDGPKDDETLLKMLEVAYESGTRTLVATPHMFLEPYNNNDLVFINDAYARMVQRLKELTSEGKVPFVKDLSIFVGAENYISLPFLEAVREQRVVTLNGSRYLLVEFPLLSDPSRFSGALERVFESDFVPIIAHPERNMVVQERPQLMRRFVELGYYCQIDAASIRGRWGKGVQKTALQLLNEGLVHLVASDGHRARHRRPRLDEAFEYLSRSFSSESLSKWFQVNPRRVLENESSLLSAGRLGSDKS